MTTQPPVQPGVARLYDHCLRLLSTARCPSNAPTANLDHALMCSYGAVVTFTLTGSDEATVDLLGQLRPMFTTRGSWLDQPGSTAYARGYADALAHQGHYAGRAYVEGCPSCSAPAHRPCRDGRAVLDDPHAERVTLATERTAARCEAFREDPGNVVWTSSVPLSPELRRSVPAR